MIQRIDYENYIVGSICSFEGDILPDLTQNMTEDDLRYEIPKAVFSSAVKLAEEGKPVLLPSVLAEARKTVNFEDQYIAECMKLPIRKENVPEYAKQIHEDSERTRLADKYEDLAYGLRSNSIEPIEAKALEDEAISKAVASDKDEQLSEVMEEYIPPIDWIVRDMLTPGLTLLCAPPKLGKSWMALDLCLCLAYGEPFLRHSTTKCNSLYLALEDSKRRIQTRTKKILQGRKPPDGVYIRTDAPDMGHGLIRFLESKIKKLDLRLIIIDTFQKVRSTSNSKDLYARDYKETGDLQKLGQRMGVCIILIHHLKKGSADTATFERISGTTGITGASDTMIVLSRSAGQDLTTTMSITGRDVYSNDFVIQFDKEACRWLMRNTVEEWEAEQAKVEYATSPLVKTIKKMVDQTPDHRWKASLKTIRETVKALEGEEITSQPSVLKSQLINIQPMLFSDGIAYEVASNGKNRPTGYHIFYSVSHDFHVFEDVTLEELPENEDDVFRE